jgi:hypothetical protein
VLTLAQRRDEQLPLLGQPASKEAYRKRVLRLLDDVAKAVQTDIRDLKSALLFTYAIRHTANLVRLSSAR